MKLNIFVQLYKSMVCKQDQTKDFPDIMGYTWKRLDLVILICVSWFVSIIQNFNALCDAYLVERQSYTVLLKNNRIFCLILGIAFG